jgi:hypothetical protein
LARDSAFLFQRVLKRPSMPAQPSRNLIVSLTSAVRSPLAKLCHLIKSISICECRNRRSSHKQDFIEALLYPLSQWISIGSSWLSVSSLRTDQYDDQAWNSGFKKAVLTYLFAGLI